MGFATHLGPWLLGTVKNTTGTTAGTIRNTGAVICSQSVPITFNNTTPIQLAVLPAGSQILLIFIDVLTEFNANASNIIRVVAPNRGNSVMMQASNTSPVTSLTTGRATNLTYSDNALSIWTNVGTTDLITTAVYIPSATGSATSGDANITIVYIVRGSNGATNSTASQT
jgi:hypothetical protein